MQTTTEKQIVSRIRPQRQVVLDHLNCIGVITKNYALQHYGIKNLAEIIRRIRKLNVDIETTALDSDVIYELK